MVDDDVVILQKQEDDDVLVHMGEDQALVPGDEPSFFSAAVDSAVALVPDAAKGVVHSAFTDLWPRARDQFDKTVKLFKKRMTQLGDELVLGAPLESEEQRRQNLDVFQVLQILADLIPGGMSVQTSGGHTVGRDTAQTVLPMQQHIKCVAKFQKHDIGHGSTGVTNNYAIIGAFNPFHVMNSEVVTRTPSAGHATDFLHEASSHFLVHAGGTPSVTRVRQWDAPQIMRLHKAEAIYDRYHVTSVKVIALFTNVDTSNTIKVWGRFFHQADHRVGPAFATDSFGWPADQESLRNLELVTAGSDVYNSVSRIAVDRLDGTPGMHVITLGPNSANGPPNQAALMFEVPCRTIATGLSSTLSYVTPVSGHLQEGVEPEPWNRYRLEDTTVLHDNFQQPMIYFWAAEFEDGSSGPNNGQIKPIFGGDSAGSSLYVEGTAEYGVHLFEARNPAAIGKADDMS